MKKKAFTLIELLAVIVILAIILAIAIPTISGIINNATKEAFLSDAKMVLKAVDYKLLEDPSFKIEELDVEKVATDLKLGTDNYNQIYTVMQDDKIKIVIEGKGKWNGLTAYGTYQNIRVVNSEDLDLLPPVITLLGDNPVTINQGDEYVDAGATANDNKDGDLTFSIEVTNNVN
ncbi:MAG: DUF5011 domain-containing protein, partial [Bacilli bacterium]|nr:DUF5011 domain-containing protein [Bacilli bacterium]